MRLSHKLSMVLAEALVLFRLPSAIWIVSLWSFLCPYGNCTEPVELRSATEETLNFGITVSSLSDVNGDTFPDICVGSRRKVEIFDGRTGNHLRTIDQITGSPVPLGFGGKVISLGDLNNNGSGDIAVAAADFADDGEIGRVFVIDGGTGRLIYSVLSPDPNNSPNFGSSLSNIPDLNDDGHLDLLVGDTTWETMVNKARTVYGGAHIYDGVTGTYIRTVIPTPNLFTRISFGSSVSGIPDVNGDGHGDIVVGSPRNPNSVSNNYGVVYVFDGASGQLLHNIPSPRRINWYVFGTSVSGIPDVNGDGAGDIAVGTGYRNLHIVDGRTGNILRTIDTPSPVNTKGSFLQIGGSLVSGIPDINHNGTGDVLVGISQDNNDAGHAYIFGSSPKSVGRILS